MRHSRCPSGSLKYSALSTDSSSSGGGGGGNEATEVGSTTSLPEALKSTSMNHTGVFNTQPASRGGGGGGRSRYSLKVAAKILLSILCLSVIILLSNQSICYATQAKRTTISETNNNNVKTNTNNNNNNNTDCNQSGAPNPKSTNCHHNHHTISPRSPHRNHRANESSVVGIEQNHRPQNIGPSSRFNSTIKHHKRQQRQQQASDSSGQVKGGSSSTLSANDPEQSASKPSVPPSPSRRAKGTAMGKGVCAGGSGSGGANCHNNSQKSSGSGAGAGGAKRGSGAASQCSGCLHHTANVTATPQPYLPIIGGDLIVPLKQDRQQQQQSAFYQQPYYGRPEANGAGQAYESSYSFASSAYPNPQGHYNYHPLPAAAINSFGPHSDDKCPMTGPLTVCDQIGSYPVDIILSRLDGAKRKLEKSYFNLDSLFTDERDHSSDPFEGEDGPQSVNGAGGAGKPNVTHGANLNNNFSHHTNAVISGHYVPSMNYANSNYSSEGRGMGPVPWYGGGGSGASGSQNGRPEKHQPPAAADYHAVEAYRSHPRRNKHELNPTTWVPVRGATGERGWLDTDEFVNLVKHRAVSLAGPTGQYTGPTSGGRKEALNRTRSNQYPAYLTKQPHHHHQQQQQIFSDQEGPIIILGNVLANRLLSIGDSLSKYSDISKRPTAATTTTYNTDRGYQSYQAALSAATSGSSTTPIANSNPTPTNATSTTLTDPSSSKSRLRKRLRRQVGLTNLGRDQQPATVVDPERISEAANAGRPPPEPVCRARSIYISPRAALNDKKQWKYVVNAAERDPQIRQIIRVDICEDPLGPCSEQFTVPFGFTSQCKQKYSKKKLLALDSQSGLLEVDTFFIPSCCVCQLVRDRQPPEGDETEGARGPSSGNEDSPDGPTNGRDNSLTMETPAPGDSPAEGPTGDSAPATENPEVGFGPETAES